MKSLIVKLLIVLAITGNYSKLQAQKLVTPDSYLLLLYYNEKTEAKYNVVSTQSSTKAGKTTTNGSSYTMGFNVVSFTDTSAVMDIKYSNIKAIGEKFEGFDEIARITEALTIKVALDQAGSYVGMLNYADCKAQFDNMLKALKKQGKQDSASLKIWETVLMPLFSSEEMMEYSLLEDFFYLAFPYGIEVPRKTPVKAVSEIGNLLGGDPYPAKLTMTAGPYVTGKTIQVNSQIVLDKVAGKAILKESLAALLGIPEITEAHISKFNITDSYTHVLNADNGWPVSIAYKRSTAVENSKGVKSVTFVRTL